MICEEIDYMQTTILMLKAFIIEIDNFDIVNTLVSNNFTSPNYLTLSSIFDSSFIFSPIVFNDLSLLRSGLMLSGEFVVFQCGHEKLFLYVNLSMFKIKYSSS